MKPGDLVRHAPHNSGLVSTRVGLVIDVIEKKCWRTNKQGKRVDWEQVKPEPHGVVMYPETLNTISIPACELEIIE